MTLAVPPSALPSPVGSRRSSWRLVHRFAVALSMAGLPAPAVAQVPDQPELVRAVAAYDAGDLQLALQLLQAVPAALPVRDSAIRGVYLGLVHFALGERNAAADWFDRAIRLEPGLRLDPSIHSPARVAAFELARALVVEEWRALALSAEERGNEEEAAGHWRRVRSAEPGDAQAADRIGAIEQAAAGREARRQAEAVPPPAATRAEPESADPDLSPRRRYEPARVFALGLLVPGLGEVVTGRPVLGVLAMAAAGGAVAAGYLSERVQIDCASVPVGDVCPPSDILSERVNRPYLWPGLATAAGIAVLSAVDALFAARRANAQAASPSAAAAPPPGLRLTAPALVVGPAGLRARILGLRFQ